MIDTDGELVAAFQAGDSAALETLYRRHAERIWRYGRFYSGDDERASEIVQETFIRVARHLPNFEGRSRFSTWLYQVSRSVAIDVTRRQRRQPEALDEQTMNALPADANREDSAEPLARVELDETRAAVRSAVAQLPENEREAVVLCELQDLSVREACEVLGWTESRVKVTLFRARRRLKGLLERYVKAEAV
ncbi:MAG: RNA polymerase sigma factor [Planctomycetes bacterium]|nr:RNA polymerase sigma factor [Planctomycetota bacterium]